LGALTCEGVSLVRGLEMKKWLQDNKIYFETIAAALIGIASIFLTIASIRVASETNKISKMQVQMARAEHLPVLDLVMDIQKEPEGKVYAYDQLTVRNLGSPLSEFSEEEATFFKVEYITQLPYKRFIARIPVNA
jgi:hypothetical protein